MPRPVFICQEVLIFQSFLVIHSLYQKDEKKGKLADDYRVTDRDQTAVAFFSLILFWHSMMRARTASFSFLSSSSLPSFSFCRFSSIKNRLLFYDTSFSQRSIVSPAMFSLVTPFISSSLQESRVLAELSKLLQNSGNFLVRM